ncbi:MAG: hypothetical protein P8Y44_01585 [Acidobacteriota bacterium]
MTAPRNLADKVKIAELEARVASLEQALEKRSRELRLIQKFACSTDLVLIHRVSCGLPPLPQYAYELSRWTESTSLTRSDVEKALTDLWGYVSMAETAAELED